ncbi:MAG: hypothetical protein Q9208_001460 [Pyrenodesmia sp. 3 TL-2023]
MSDHSSGDQPVEAEGIYVVEQLSEATQAGAAPQSNTLRNAVEPVRSILDEPGPPEIVFSRHTNPPLPVSDPNQPCRQLRQTRMINALSAIGPMALAKVLYEEAEDEIKRGDASLSARAMIADRDNKTFHVISLLYTLPTDVTKSLIQGTLPYDILRKESIKEFHDQFMQPDNHPGIFMRMLARSDASLPEASHDDQGMWLSCAQIERILDAFEAYLNNTYKANGIDLDPTLEPAFRIWTQTVKTTEQAKEWCKYMRQIYCEMVDPTKHSNLHRRCPTEVVFSGNLAATAAKVGDAAPSTYSSSFLNAFPRLATSHGGTQFEILGSRLTGSEVRFGGYNVANAGSFTITLGEHDSSCENAINSSWEKAIENTYGRLEYTGHPEASEAKALEFYRQWESYKPLPESEKELEELREEIRKVRKDQEDADRRLGAARLAYNESQARYQGAQEKQPKRERMTQLLERLQSNARVEKAFKQRRLELSEQQRNLTDSGPPTEVGPLLSEEETAKVETKIAAYNARVDAGVKEMMDKMKQRRAEEAEREVHLSITFNE